MDINGIPDYFPTRPMINRDFKIIETKSMLGKKVYHLQGNHSNVSTFNAYATGPPEFLVLKYEILLNDTKKFDTFYEIDEITEFNGIFYPSKGKYRRDKIDHRPELSYEFKVKSIEYLQETDRNTWFPDWPDGTNITDQINDKVITTDRDIEKLKREYETFEIKKDLQIDYCLLLSLISY